MSRAGGTLKMRPKDVARVELCLTRALVIGRVSNLEAERGLSGNEEGSTS